MLDFLKKGKGELLNFFFNNPDKEYYLSEIAKSLNKETSYYQRQLNSLVKDEILLDKRKGNLRFFKLNKNNPLYSDLKSIISKSLGIEFKLKNLVNKFDSIETAFIFGSLAKNKENPNSDIDLMLIGENAPDLLPNKISRLENELNREINFHIYSKKEFIEKINKKDSFVINIISDSLITLKGDPHEFAKLATK